MLKAKISVKGGVATLVQKDLGVEITIEDYDNDPYTEEVFPSESKVEPQ